MTVLALCPSRGRPEAAAETLTSFLATRRDPRTRLLFIVDEDDPTRAAYPAACTMTVTATGCMGMAMQVALRQSILKDATVVGMIGDDNRFRTAGWDVDFAAVLEKDWGVAYGDDGFQHERLPTSWWLSRPIVDAFGMADAGLKHLYMDNYWLEMGQGAGCLNYLPGVIIEHLHPLAGKARQDDIYARSHRWAFADRSYFARWQRQRKVRDVRRLRMLLEAATPRRVLADWHHPALWESLSILFEDRFGWELYSPLGEEWTQHGWTYALHSIGWTPKDYLVFSDARPVGDHYERLEPEFPLRPRKMVTWEQANSQPWDFVLASLAPHQRSFSALAAQWKARFVHQIGNAKHPIDRRVPQITLASAKVPPARTVIPYHQEFDLNLFAFEPPQQPDVVTSFMLRLDSTSGPYRWLADAPGVRWRSMGGADPRDPSYLAPMSRVAEALLETGWVWHDKTIGDGYGHVLHNAMAMGRPLIGHRSNYRGLLGEPFWEDLKTCIDLDQHSERDALRLWTAISADPDWHSEMAERCYQRFAQTVNFDAEAARIREALLT